jgi:hypothetical protein
MKFVTAFSHFFFFFSIKSILHQWLSNFSCSVKEEKEGGVWSPSIKNKASLFALTSSQVACVHEVSVVLENCSASGERRLRLRRYKSPKPRNYVHFKIIILSVRFSVDAATYFTQLTIKPRHCNTSHWLRNTAMCGVGKLLVLTYEIQNLRFWFRGVSLCYRVHKSCRLEGATSKMSGNINPLHSLTTWKLRFFKVTAVGTSNLARYANC